MRLLFKTSLEEGLIPALLRFLQLDLESKTLKIIRLKGFYYRIKERLDSI
jgi:hypothetical protein